MLTTAIAICPCHHPIINCNTAIINSVKRRPTMNKSIAKTRNELQRITYKINQLKTKYTGESYPHHPHPHPNIENSPLDDSYQDQYSDQRQGPTSNRDHVLASKCVPTFNNARNKGYDELYQKDLKVFRNEIYNYVDKCLVMTKEREQEIIEKAVQGVMGTSRAGKLTTDREDRIRKVQEETTSCLATLQEVIAQIKRNQKSLSQKIFCAQYKLKKQIKQVASRIEQGNSTSMEEQIRELIENKLTQIQSQLQQQLPSTNQDYERLVKQLNEMNQTQQKLQKDIDEMRSIMIDWQDEREEQKRVETGIADLRDSVFNDIKDWATQNITQLEQKYQEIKQLGGRTSQCQAKLQKLSHLKLTIEQSAKKVQQIETRQKQGQKHFSQQLSLTKSQILQNVPEIELISKQTQVNIETSYLKPRLEQLKRELNTKFNQEIEFNKQEIMINVEETIFEKVNKFYLQEKQRKSPKVEFDQSKLLLKQDLIGLETQLKSLVAEQIDDKLEKQFSRSLAKIQALDTSLNISSRQKTVEEEQMENKRTEQLIEAKLNQFEGDINETIKLLYEDIQNRVNEMIGHCGIAQLKADMESLKRQAKDIETKVKSLTLIATTNPPPITNQQDSSAQYFENLRSQVYSDMGCQIDKISHILERAIEQMEGKVQKLDANFTYIYERMSKIEYDNANFKDQLAQKSALAPTKVETKPDTVSSSNHLLEALGQYNAGRYFFEGG